MDVGSMSAAHHSEGANGRQQRYSTLCVCVCALCCDSLLRSCVIGLMIWLMHSGWASAFRREELPFQRAACPRGRRVEEDAGGGGSGGGSGGETLSLIRMQRDIERPCDSLFCLS